MPSLSEELETLWVYHPDYPTDITGMAVSQEGERALVTPTITNYGGEEVTMTLVASAKHLATYFMPRSEETVVTIPAGGSVEVTLELSLKDAPAGDYLVQGILSTGPPRYGGFPLTYRETTITLGG